MGKLMSYLHEWPHPMKSIDLRKLNHALVIAEAASYARASERLHLTQSALTRSIQALESELGLQLFDRGKSGVRPTVDGEKILDRARYLLLQARAFEREVDLLKQGEHGEIAFGVGPAMPCLFLPELLTEMCSQHPDLRIDVAIESGHRLLDMLREEAIEFFAADIHQLGELDANLYAIEPLVDIPADFYVRSGHPLAASSVVTGADMNSYPLISAQHRKPLWWEKTDDSTDKKRNNQASKQLLCNDINTLRCIIRNTDAILIGIPQMVGEELAAGLVRPLAVHWPDPRPVCALALVSLAGRTASIAGAMVSAAIRGLLTADA